MDGHQRCGRWFRIEVEGTRLSSSSGGKDLCSSIFWSVPSGEHGNRCYWNDENILVRSKFLLTYHHCCRSTQSVVLWDIVKTVHSLVTGCCALLNVCTCSMPAPTNRLKRTVWTHIISVFLVLQVTFLTCSFDSWLVRQLTGSFCRFLPLYSGGHYVIVVN